MQSRHHHHHPRHGFPGRLATTKTDQSTQRSALFPGLLKRLLTTPPQSDHSQQLHPSCTPAPHTDRPRFVLSSAGNLSPSLCSVQMLFLTPLHIPPEMQIAAGHSSAECRYVRTPQGGQLTAWSHFNAPADTQHFAAPFLVTTTY